MKSKLFIASLGLLPAVALAQNGLPALTNTAESVQSIVNILVPTAYALAFGLFFYGLALAIFKSGEDQTKGKNMMIWGAAALFVMTSLVGIFNFVGGAVGVNAGDERDLTPPTITK